MDKLEQIMKMQGDLQKRLGTDFSNMTDEERAEFMRNHRGYLEDELAEALYEMPNYKLWKDYSNMNETDRNVAWQKVRLELIDCLHFFVNLLLCSGMSADEVYQMYMMKNKENHRRQDEGYTADVSYREQSVEDVMTDKSTCVVEMNGKAYISTDFIAILCTPDGETTLHYNTDVVTMGMAIQMISRRYAEHLASLPEETQNAVREVLANG